ncbi:hypothetical protein H5410_004129 [Solanum commersonii]|uniref:Uncharacterized protein n=1 Tax=Solanum commersonii TaxID=4109 RepID=A0A9J6B780_SOLCO|nr:hypothetical protein H5410_004129 [Solanum commersonii]
MASGGEGNRSREHLEVSQPNKSKKKKSMRPIDPEDIPQFLSSTPERITHDTHLLSVSFNMADPRAYYPNYCRLVGASSTSQTLNPRHYEDLPLEAIHRSQPLSIGRSSAGTPSPSPSPTCIFPQLSATRIRDSSSEKPNIMDNTPLLTQHYMHPDLSPSPTPSATLDETWHPTNDAARALKDSMRRLFTQAYHSRSDIPNSIRHAMFNDFKEAHKGRVYGRGPLNDVRLLVSGLEDIGSSRQAETLVGVQIAAMSAQIAKMTEALEELERRRVAEQENMCVFIKSKNKC